MSTGVGVRLLLAHLLLSVIVLGAVELVLGPRLQRELLRQLDQRLYVAARAVADFLEEGQPPLQVADRAAATTALRIT